MLAKIIPLKRLPKGLDLFDYQVPKSLEADIKPGQLVTIPFRKSDLYGLVFDLKNDQLGNSNTKEIKSIVNKIPFLSKKQLSFLELAKNIYGISFGSMTKIAMIPLQKRKLKKIELVEIVSDQKNINKTKYLNYQDETEHIEKLNNQIEDNTLILVPELQMIDQILEQLDPKIKSKILVWHGSLSTKEKFDNWLDIRNSKKTIVLGTRGALFLPFQKLKKIIIDFEQDENHKHWDQSPRFHTHDLSKILSDIYGSEIIKMSYSISSDTYHAIFKGDTEFAEKKGIGPVFKKRNLQTLSIIDMTRQSSTKEYSNLSVSSKREIQKSISEKKDIFILLNRKGYATSLNCLDCGYRKLCTDCSLPMVFHSNDKLYCHWCRKQENLSIRCQKCNSEKLKLYGSGIETIKKELNKELDIGSDYEIICLDSEKEQPPSSSHNKIIIGTTHAFNYINWQKTGFICMLDFDRQISIPEFSAHENAWHLINKMLYLKNPLANFFIQSYNIENYLLKSLAEPDKFYRLDLNHRKKLENPPYSYLVRYFIGDFNQEKALKQAKKLDSKIAQQLTKDQKNIKLVGPLEMHPKFYRERHWFMIIAKFDARSWIDNLIYLNSFIPHNWKIDPNPISILRP